MSVQSKTRQTISRRSLLKGTGVLIVGFSLASPRALLDPAVVRAQAPPAPPPRLDSWLAITADNQVTLFVGKVDLGTGVETALSQIAAEELDVAMAQLNVVQGDTARSPDQAQTVGSFSVAVGGAQIRRAAAEGRQILLEMAAERLGVPSERLTVRDGVVSVAGDPSRGVTYGALVGGRQLEIELSGDAKPKDVSQYTIVGQPVPRVDIPAKMYGTFEYVQNVRVPGMLHGRIVRPTPQSGATLVSVDESSVRDVPGLVRVVPLGNVVGVVAEREEQAIRAARQLKVTWSDPAALPEQRDVFTVLRNTPSSDRLLQQEGDVEAALAGAAKAVQATYEFPFQLHAMMGPSCGVADVRADGATVWSGTQYPHGFARLLTTRLGLPEGTVRVIYSEGSGCYGRYTTDDAAFDAAQLSKAVGRPVRVQWMRADEHGWDHGNTPMVFDMRGGLDAAGNVVAYEHQAWSAHHVGQSVLADQTGGNWVVPIGAVFVGDDTPKFYEFANRQYILHALDTAPFRYGNNRSLGAMLSSFAAESFMDELAAAAGADPLTFRLRYLHEERGIDALKAAVERAGWDSRPSPKPGASRTGIARGRGLALGEYGQPTTGTTWVGMVAEVAVDLDSGQVRVERLVVSHDCGLIVNPDGVRNQVEGNVLQSLSRTLHEELTWDRTGITSVDWRSYPVLTFSEVPPVDVVLVDRPDLRSSGAGEAATIPTAAVIANAIYDATGLRLRRVPFTPERVKAALNAGA